MARLSRYFTPPMSSAQRWLFLEMTLLSHLPIQFKEVNEAQELYIQESLEGKVRSLSPRGYRETNPTLREVRIQVNDWSNTQKTGSATSQSYFFEVAPYPFNLLFLSKNCGLGTKSLLDFSPNDFAAQIDAFGRAVKRLETEMEESELCLLWVKRDEARLPLLFHFVRRRLVRVGSLPELLDIGLKFDRGMLQPEDLRQFFGTQTNLFSLDFSRTYLEIPSLSALQNCWERTLNEPEFRVKALLPTTSPSHSIYPDLEL